MGDGQVKLVRVTGRGKFRGGKDGVLRKKAPRLEFFAVLQLCLSEGAGLSIILPSPHPTSWSAFLYTAVLHRNQLNGPFGERVLEDRFHFGFSQEL